MIIETYTELENEVKNKQDILFSFFWKNKKKYEVVITKIKTIKGKYWFYQILDNKKVIKEKTENLKTKLIESLKDEIKKLGFKDNTIKTWWEILDIKPKKLIKNIKIEVLCWLPGSWKTTYAKSIIQKINKEGWIKYLYIDIENWEIDHNLKYYSDTYDTNLENRKFKGYNKINKDLLNDLKQFSKNLHFDNLKVIIDWVLLIKKEDYKKIREIFKDFSKIKLTIFNCINKKDCISNVKLREDIDSKKINALLETIQKRNVEIPNEIELNNNLGWTIIELEIKEVKDYQTDELTLLKKKLNLSNETEYLYTNSYQYWEWKNRWFDEDWNDVYRDANYDEKETSIREIDSFPEEIKKEVAESLEEIVDNDMFDPYRDWEYRKGRISLKELLEIMKEHNFKISDIKEEY